MSRRAQSGQTVVPSVLGLPERLTRLLTHRHARWGAPLAAALAALLISVWTFDAKLGISGDNTEFVTLARSLAHGDGLTYTNLPEPRPATKYPFGFPLMLAPLAAIFDGWSGPGSGTPDWVAMKWLVVCSLAAGMGAFHLLARGVAGDLVAVAATALAVTNPLTVSYGHQVMSEVPYLAPSLLALWCLHRGIEAEGWRHNRWLWTGVAAAIAAYYIRSVGLVLIGAPIALLLLRRDWQRAALIGGVSFAAILPWSLRNSAVGGGGVYFKQLVQVNPYFPDQGLLDAAGLWERITDHLQFYLAQGLTQTLWPSFEPTGAAFTPAAAVMLALLGGFAWRSVQQGRHLLLLIYASFFLGTVLLWPWPGDRFILPLVPVLLLAGVITVADAVHWLRAKGAGPTAYVLAVVLLGLGLHGNVFGRTSHQPVRQPTSLVQYARASQADYLPEWRNYFEAGLWLRANTPQDAIVTCRKAFWMHVISGRRTFVYAFAEPQQVMADLDAKGADYAVVEQLGYAHTPRFLVPALQWASDRCPILWHRPEPDTYIVAINPL
ncbi:MAG: glycosyltransferase family 39 protein [bacterium]|nr:glycosyltransferase family 39 protein [bacterium]